MEILGLTQTIETKNIVVKFQIQLPPGLRCSLPNPYPPLLGQSPLLYDSLDRLGQPVREMGRQEKRGWSRGRVILLTGTPSCSRCPTSRPEEEERVVR